MNYGGQIQTRVYNSNEIRQITQSYKSSSVNPCCWYCCKEYECTVSISLGEFGHDGLQNEMLSTNANYLEALKNSVNAFISGIESRFEIGNSKTLFVCSKKEDMVHNGIVRDVIEDMGSVYRAVLDSLPPTPKVFVKNDEYVKQQINGATTMDLSGKLLSTITATSQFPVADLNPF